MNPVCVREKRRFINDAVCPFCVWVYFSNVPHWECAFMGSSAFMQKMKVYLQICLVVMNKAKQKEIK